jgi:hypothetical protein
MLYKYSHHFAIFIIATVCEISTSLIFLADARAQTFEPPTVDPTPIITIGGGRRTGDGQCLKDRHMQTSNVKADVDFKAKKSLEQQLILLLPPNKFGLTIASNPQFFAYVPKTSAIAVEFVLENQQGKGIAHKRLELTNTPSIVNVQFEKRPLEVGKDYKWLVSIVCENGDPEDAFVEGIIRRIKPEAALVSKLEKASAIEKVNLFAKFGIWQDAIANLADLRLSQPNSADLKNSWLTLLKSASLTPLANISLKQ